ncbi:MAG TPA: phosphoglucosamine mutase [Deltaproteobacteria bacterium]|nr:MAG: phosphoglucosamine mutase [Deltaproteobacteria bacterium GWA2_55_82]OGQ63730.1 MAG: phosphoglucosamine mutase [Deltaproteobacteria bacterium RIFCSPLOWO2_02_FULL_55_12]OIJ73453.1 MAG: phosphoglucosamine mutase [Deltaproteobacteria bacterium GWC2_55_46]HBG47318.1 phosphoglucosamine mutase [Deltaproteobacteria bacterium]HCY10084.1 phosphoglucosamine mutase [Deltaproteobacteria bacterium]
MRVKKRLFGTDGVRGVANIEPMTSEMALQLGRAIAYIFKQEARRHRIVIGKDTRLSGYMLESAMMAGICSMGVDALMVGPLPTPGIAFITSSMRADAGVVISASHNPYQDNGIKFFSRDGLKLPDDLELKIEQFIFENHDPSHRPTAREVGKAYRVDDAIGRYVVFAKNTFPKELTLDGLKIAVDCANGAAYKVAPSVFYELGAEVITTGVSPDGENINHECGALYPEKVASLVRATGAHVGFALDGDGDRCIMVDERGNVLDGDYILAICASGMLKEGTLKGNTVVSTIMSNSGFEEAIRNAGGKVIRTAVGDRYVVEEMLRGGYNLGGEQSGHIIYLDHTTTGDGVISGLQVLKMMVQEGKPLSELAKVMTTYPQILLNVKVREKKDLGSIPAVAKALKDVEEKLKDKGRAFIRYSGTEPLARITIEGERKEEIAAMASELAEVLKKEIG